MIPVNPKHRFGMQVDWIWHDGIINSELKTPVDWFLHGKYIGDITIHDGKSY
jgi:hypothetical protein